MKTFAASAMSKPPPAGPQVMPRAVDSEAGAGYPQCAAVEGQPARGRAEIVVGGHLQYAARQSCPAAVAVASGEDERARVGLVDAARARDRRGEFGRHAGIDAHKGRAHRHERAARAGDELVAVGYELQACEGLGACDRDRAGRTGEDREAAVPGRRRRAVLVGPVGRGRIPGAGAAVDRVVRRHLRPVPELGAGRRALDDQVDLGGDRRLHAQGGGAEARRHGADGEPVVGQRAAIVEQAETPGPMPPELLTLRVPSRIRLPVMSIGLLPALLKRLGSPSS